MTTEQLEQIFNDNSDCFADTWKSELGIMEEGEVVPDADDIALLKEIRDLLKNRP